MRAEHALERALAGAPPEHDEVERLLATGSREEVRLRRERLARALSDFDSATIATTHQFCQIVLRSLGVSSRTQAVLAVSQMTQGQLPSFQAWKPNRRG